MDAEHAGALRQRAARTSVLSNTALTALKLVIGVFTGSVSVLAEALHSGLDLGAALIAFFAVRKAREPADLDHTFGHGKFESMSGLIEGALILAAVGLICWGAVGHLLSGSAGVRGPGLGAGVMAVSAVVNVFVSRMLFRVARQTDSVALEADAWHLRTDVYTSGAVLFGMVAIAIGERIKVEAVQVLDPIVAIGVALWIARAAWDVMHRSWDHLVDRSLPDWEVEQIRRLLREHYPDFGSYHQLRTRRAGPHRHVDLHLEVPGRISVAESHALCDRLEEEIRQLLPRTEVLIHVEPKEQSEP